MVSFTIFFYNFISQGGIICNTFINIYIFLGVRNGDTAYVMTPFVHGTFFILLD